MVGQARPKKKRKMRTNRSCHEYLEARCCNTMSSNEVHDEHMAAQLQRLRASDTGSLQPHQVAPLLLSPHLHHLARIVFAVAGSEPEVSRHIPEQHRLAQTNCPARECDSKHADGRQLLCASNSVCDVQCSSHNRQHTAVLVGTCYKRQFGLPVSVLEHQNGSLVNFDG